MSCDEAVAEDVAKRGGVFHHWLLFGGPWNLLGQGENIDWLYGSYLAWATAVPGIGLIFGLALPFAPVLLVGPIVLGFRYLPRLLRGAP